MGCSDLEPHNEGLLCHVECLYKNSEFLHSPATATEALSALHQSGARRPLSGIQRAWQSKNIRRLARRLSGLRPLLPSLTTYAPPLAPSDGRREPVSTKLSCDAHVCATPTQNINKCNQKLNFTGFIYFMCRSRCLNVCLCTICVQCSWVV